MKKEKFVLTWEANMRSTVESFLVMFHSYWGPGSAGYPYLGSSWYDGRLLDLPLRIYSLA